MSYRGVRCQSNHVAQHLRRASILEDRKARLADRAAHAEQVRLRAALVKATPRASNSEERALAAQQARQKRLAQVAAACAEEVKRAKKVAEDLKEQRAAEEQRYRQEMKEKLAEAERRRLEYQRTVRRPRTASVPSTEAKRPVTSPTRTLDKTVAAKRIQAAWKTLLRKRMLDDFAGLGLALDRVRETSFEEISAMLADTNVLGKAAKILSFFKLQCDDEQSASQTGTRTFLSAYLILSHPDSVFSKEGDQEQDLITKTKDFMICFESTIAKLSAINHYVPSPTQLEALSLAHSTFTSAFTAWKAQDSSALVETMIATFVNLDAIWQSVKDFTEGEVATDYREGIRDNQVILLSKIRKLAGPERANILIKKAIRESRRQKALTRRRRPTGDIRPRPAVEQALAESATHVDASTTADETNISPEPTPDDGAHSSSLARVFSVIPDNRILTHELALDKDYRIDVSPHSDIRDEINREVCQGMRRAFEQGRGDVWTVAVAENIRSKLLRLLKQGNSLHTVISETLDPELIRTQCIKGMFSYAKFFSFMATVLPKLCAPFRDAQVKALTDILTQDGDVDCMFEKLFKLLHIIDLLSLDYSNFLLSVVAPNLIREAPGYEQRRFAEDLENNKITLDRTKRWWRNASVNVLTEADQRDPLHRPTTAKMYARGLVDLAIATTPLQDTDVPETLELDKARLSKIRADSLRITTIGAILLNAKNLLKRDARSQWKAEATRMWDALIKEGYKNESDTMPSKLLSILESSHNLPPVTKSHLLTSITVILNQAHTGRFANPVLKVLFQRIKGHVFTRLSASSSGERVRAASNATASLASSGLSEFINQIGDIVELLGKVSEVDCRAHGLWYEQIAKEVEEMGDGQQST